MLSRRSSAALANLTHQPPASRSRWARVVLLMLAMTLAIQGIGTATLRTHGAAHVHRSVQPGVLEQAVLHVLEWLRADAARSTHAALARLDGHRGLPDLQPADDDHAHHHDEVGHHHHEPGTAGVVAVDGDDHSTGKTPAAAQRNPHEADGLRAEPPPVADRVAARHPAAADASPRASHISEPLERPPRA